MTLNEYVVNPLGKGDSSLPGGKLLIKQLEDKYYALDREKGKLIKMDEYFDPYSGSFYFHLVIPSETKRTNTYDVVICFQDPDKKHRGDLSIKDYDVTFFANTPSFAYTFAYVYNEYGLLIPFLANKLGKEMITKAPIVRNQYEIVSYDKYLFFAAKYILDSKMMNKAALQLKEKRFGQRSFSAKIRTLDQIMKEYKQAAGKLKTSKRYEKNESAKLKNKPKKLSIGGAEPIGTVGHKESKTSVAKKGTVSKTNARIKSPRTVTKLKKR